MGNDGHQGASCTTSRLLAAALAVMQPCQQPQHPSTSLAAGAPGHHPQLPQHTSVPSPTSLVGCCGLAARHVPWVCDGLVARQAHGDPVGAQGRPQPPRGAGGPVPQPPVPVCKGSLDRQPQLLQGTKLFIQAWGWGGQEVRKYGALGHQKWPSRPAKAAWKASRSFCRGAVAFCFKRRK